MTEPQKTTAPSQIIVDGIALQQALRAAVAIAPGSSPKEEYAVVGVKLPTTADGVVSVTARNPKLNLSLSVMIPSEDVDLVDMMDEYIEITLTEARRLLAQKCSIPKEDEPWPSLAWEITSDRVKQTDADVLFGRRTDVYRVDRGQHVLGDITGTLTELTDAVPSATGHGSVTSKQLKVVAQALGHLGEDPTSVPLEPGANQSAAALWLTESAMIHSTTPAKDKASAGDDQAPEVSFDDHAQFRAAAENLRSTLDRTGTTLTVVGANPPGGIA